jgi:hypothetical protein
MGWKRVPEEWALDPSEFSGQRRARFYADEDIEDEVVEVLRNRGANIVSARELGYLRKPDSFHVAYALKKRRFILTKNARHYMDDAVVPPNLTHGVVVLDVRAGDTDAMAGALARLLETVLRFGDWLQGCKVRLSPQGEEILFTDKTGKRRRARFRSARGWVEYWDDGSLNGVATGGRT